MVGGKFSGRDELNIKRTRNIKNTERKDFNCAGYALETFSWYLPIPEVQYWEDDSEYFDSSIDVESRTRLCVNTMLEDFSSLREICDISELASDEYAIAFRMEKDDSDFHFVKRCQDGIWRHKRGARPDIEIMTTEEVFSPCWESGNAFEEFYYNGPIILFAKKISA